MTSGLNYHRAHFDGTEIAHIHHGYVRRIGKPGNYHFKAVSRGYILYEGTDEAKLKAALDAISTIDDDELPELSDEAVALKSALPKGKSNV